MDFETDLDWKLVKAFVAVMEAGTLSGAARKLGVTQPTLGRQIRDLETVAGDVLFVRRGLRLEPTENARALLPHAQEIEQEIFSFGNTVRNLGEDKPRRKITITAPTLLCDEMLPDLIPPIRETMPQTSFDIVPSDALEDIHRRSVDIALRMIKPTQPDLVARKIGKVNVCLAASRGYVNQHGSPASPLDLAHHKLILPRDDQQLKLGIEQIGLDYDSLLVVGLTDDLRSRLAFARADMGISTCHDWIINKDPTLNPILPGLVLTTFDLWLVATDDLRRSRSLREVYDQLGERIPSLLK